MTFAQWLKTIWKACASPPPTPTFPPVRGFYVVSLRTGRPVAFSTSYASAQHLLAAVRCKWPSRAYVLTSTRPSRLAGPDALRPEPSWMELSPSEFRVRQMDFLRRN